MSQEDIEAVLQQRSRFMKAITSGDAEGLIALADEAVVDMAPGMPTAAGKEQYAEGVRTLLDQNRTELTAQVRQTEASGDLAFVRSDFDGGWVPKDGNPKIALAGKWLQVWKRQSDGSWKLLQNIWNRDQ